MIVIVAAAVAAAAAAAVAVCRSIFHFAFRFALHPNKPTIGINYKIEPRFRAVAGATSGKPIYSYTLQFPAARRTKRQPSSSQLG